MLIHFHPFATLFIHCQLMINLHGSVLATTYPMLTWPADPLGGRGGAACVEPQWQFSLFQDFARVRHHWTGSWGQLTSKCFSSSFHKTLFRCRCITEKMTAKYQCERLLGSGSFGKVFLTRKEGKCYAIKKVGNAELNTAR